VAKRPARRKNPTLFLRRGRPARSKGKTMKQQRIDPSVQSILDNARSAEAMRMEALRASQERQARKERARRAWLCVANFRGRAWTVAAFRERAIS
jgi:hypothetical protein